MENEPSKMIRVTTTTTRTTIIIIIMVIIITIIGTSCSAFRSVKVLYTACIYSSHIIQ